LNTQRERRGFTLFLILQREINVNLNKKLELKNPNSFLSFHIRFSRRIVNATNFAADACFNFCSHSAFLKPTNSTHFIDDKNKLSAFKMSLTTKC